MSPRRLPVKSRVARAPGSRTNEQPRIAWGSPLPPTRSGVADYAAEVIPELAKLTEVRVFAPPGWSPPAGRDAQTVAAELPWDADTPSGFTELLHLGNNPYHLWVARRLRRSGGLVVLHDTVMHHLLVEEAAADQDWARFATELEAAHPGAGGVLARARSWGFLGPREAFLFPARAAYLSLARGVIVHGERALKQVSECCPGLPVRQVPLAVAALPTGDRREWRRRLGGEDGEILLVHLGFLTPAKGLHAVVGALSSLVSLGVKARLIVVGEGTEEASFRAVLSAAGLADRVVLWGFATREELGGILGAADLGLVTRFPTAGETSAAALRFLAAGTPIVIPGYAQFLALPTSAALRVPPGETGVADLVRWVSHLAQYPAELTRARESARRAWQEGRHDPASAAAELLRAVGEINALLA